MAAPPAPTLEGPRVRLRAPRESDLPILHRWYEDPELSAPFDRFATESLGEFAQAVRASPEDPGSLAPRFVIERKADGAPIGCVGHYRSHPVLTVLEVWYFVADPSTRGTGLGSEAVGLLVDHLFRTTAVERVGATCDVENAPSYRLLERLGFRREGVLSSVLFHHARWHDAAVYGVTRSSWRARPTPA